MPCSSSRQHIAEHLHAVRVLECTWDPKRSCLSGPFTSRLILSGQITIQCCGYNHLVPNALFITPLVTLEFILGRRDKALNSICMDLPIIPQWEFLYWSNLGVFCIVFTVCVTVCCWIIHWLHQLMVSIHQYNLNAKVEQYEYDHRLCPEIFCNHSRIRICFLN